MRVSGPPSVASQPAPGAGTDAPARGRRKRPAGRQLPAAPANAAFGYHEQPIPPGSVRMGPLQQGDQGVSPSERRHVETVAKHLFEAAGVMWLSTYDQQTGLYELRSREGVLRWERWKAPDGRILYRVHSQTGPNPFPSVDPTALRTLEEEIASAGGKRKHTPHEKTSYPDILRRLTQLYDHPRAPDILYIPYGYADQNHPGSGSHGIPSITQSRAPLIMSGPGIARGAVTDALASSTDIAPTVAQYLGVRPVLGSNGTGVQRPQWLKWQDGDSLAPAVADARMGASVTGAARQAIVFVVDGASHTVLHDEISKGRLPNIARIMRRGTTFRNGSLAEYPVVTYANHNSITTGASPGHTGIVNNSWYVREEARHQLITDGGFTNSLRVGRMMDKQVETIYEAVRRSFPGAKAVAINQPSGRGATTSILDLAGLGDVLRNGIAVVKNFLAGQKLMDPKFGKDKEYAKTAKMDNFAAAYGMALMGKGTPPKISVFELTLGDNQGHHHGPQSKQARAALREVDRNIGRVMAELEKSGKLDETMVVVTADHGMETQTRDKSTMGGWFQALDASGVKTVESTRFVYVKTMRYSVHGPAPRAGVQSQLAVRVVNDDVRTDGVRPALNDAEVKITDADGNVWRAKTDMSGVARLDVHPKRGPLKVEIVRAEFTPEAGTIQLG